MSIDIHELFTQWRQKYRRELPDTNTEARKMVFDFTHRYADYDCIDIHDVTAMIDTSERYTILRSGIAPRAINDHGYPATARYTFRVYDKQTGWMRIIPFHEAIECFLLDVHRGRTSVYRIVDQNGSAEYAAIRTKYDHVRTLFFDACWQYSLKQFPIEPLISEAERRLQQSARYQEYLQSPQWIQKKFKVFARDGYQCQQCGTGKNLVCHHTTYDNIYNERLDDLLTLCKRCHHDIHHHDLRKA